MRPQDDHATKRWRKQSDKDRSREQDRSNEVLTYQERRERRTEAEKDFKSMADSAVAAFTSGDFRQFERQLERLDALKVGTIRTLLNQEIQTLTQTQADAFNRDFQDQMNGGDDENEDDKPQMVGDQATVKDYLAGVSKSLEQDLHREMLMEQRNLLMRIRLDNPEARKYEVHNTGFDLDLVERKITQKQADRYDQMSRKREVKEYSRGQKEASCKSCFS